MLTLFRKVRHKLLTQNRFSKYLLYAIGEIVLVVIGILLALQINAWNQNKQNRVQEKQILEQLLAEYKSNLSQLESKIYIRSEVLKSSITLLEYRLQNIEEVHPDSFNLHVSRMVSRPTFDPELGVTDELNNSGKLYLIENPELRNKISSFGSLLSELHEEEMVTFNHVENLVIPFISDNYQIGYVMTEFLDDEEFRKNFTMVATDGSGSIKALFSVPVVADLLYHPEFEDHLAIMISNTTYTNEQSAGVKEKIENIIDLLKTEQEKMGED